MTRRLVLAVVVALSVSSPAFAQLDPEQKQPYLWRVVLSAKPHPLITADFRERVKRDVLAALQTGVGTLGAVEVIDLTDLPRDKWEPLWQQFDDKGFAALDTPRDLTGAKTHFLRLEYRDGKFHLETRQYDGFTGLSTPLVRAQSVRAPEQVGRTAGLMLDRDFGLVGTVEAIPGKSDEVKVLLRSSGLGQTTSLVNKGDIFSLAAVRKTNRPAPPPVRTATGKIIAPPPGTEPPPGLTSTPRDFTLLKVTEVADGSLRCTVLTRYQNAMPTTGGIIGYRCMKLGTVKAPVAVRLVGSDGTVYKTASTVNVRATDSGFSAPSDAKDVCNFHSGTAQFRTQRALSNVACVTVALGPSQGKQFPIPILSDAPVTIPFDIDPAKEELAAFERSVLAAASAVADARSAQTVCFDAVAKLIEKQKNSEALSRAQGGFNAADATYKEQSGEVARLKEQKELLEKSRGAADLLNKTEQSLTAIQQYNVQLNEHIKKIDRVVKLENDPARAAKEVQAEAINARITLLLSTGEVDQALAAFDQLITLLPDNADIKKQREKIAGEWKVKDDAHQKARDYLLKTWPAVASIQDFKESLPLVRTHVDTCKKHGDKWAMRKLLSIFSTVAPKLTELASALDPASDADKKLLKDAESAGKVLAALEVELRTFVGGE